MTDFMEGLHKPLAKPGQQKGVLEAMAISEAILRENDIRITIRMNGLRLPALQEQVFLSIAAAPNRSVLRQVIFRDCPDSSAGQIDLALRGLDRKGLIIGRRHQGELNDSWFLLTVKGAAFLEGRG